MNYKNLAIDIAHFSLYLMSAYSFGKTTGILGILFVGFVYLISLSKKNLYHNHPEN